MNKFHLKLSQDSQKVEADLSESMLKDFWVAVTEQRIVDLKIRPFFEFISDGVCVFVKRPVVVWVPVCVVLRVKVTDKSRESN